MPNEPKYTVLLDDPNIDLISRIMKVRNIPDTKEDFLNPTFERYRNDPKNLSDINIALERIKKAVENNERIMIFGDYDVDGIMSSYVLYIFFRTYLSYDNISIQLPHRQKDGYGIKSYHLDKIKELECSVVITVDNGITANQEAKHAKEIGLDLIITDHHHLVGDLPDAYAVINPQVSEKCTYKEICGATVAWKLALELADTFDLSKEIKQQYMDETLAFIGIATVADCMPLQQENRLLVRKALEKMNTSHALTWNLQGILVFLNIDHVDTYHIGFMIAPRLNATGRVGTAHDGLKCLLTNDIEKQKPLLEHMELLNTQRKWTQEAMLEKALDICNVKSGILMAASEDFHAWIVGIVAGRLTEKYYKPSVILEINKEKNIATGSLRGPSYFSIIDMLKDAEDILDRFGGHEQAWGITIALDKLDALYERFEQYVQKTVWDTPPAKVLTIDTKLYEHELDEKLLHDLEILWPYGIWHTKPIFALENVIIDTAKVIWKSERTHLKLTAHLWNTHFSIMMWGKWDEKENILLQTPVSIIWEIKKDDRNGGWYIDGKEIILDS